MQTNKLITLILIIYLLLAFLGGYRQGIMNKGRWVLSIVFAILAVPLISPFIENFLIQTKIAQMILTDIPAIQIITTRILKLLVFSLSVFLIKRLVYFLTDIDLPEGLQVVDRFAGAMFTIMEALIIIWFFEILMQFSGNASIFANIHEVLLSSSLYSFISSHNLIFALFS